ncbi:MAG: hypothetical protein QOJ73_2716 [Streptosporangiaceae bacterium]|jgi:hypothetical protein|nr:hypothetical protein [Streptosporangiaceae bacterium]
MTSQERDYDDILRRALRAAAESVEPAADGLERIRGRVSTRHFSPFMLFTEFLYDWFRPIPLWLESGWAGTHSALEWLRGRVARVQVPGRSGQAADGTGHRPRAAHRTASPPTGWRARLGPAFTRLGPAASWLKPVLAVSGAVGIVVAGVFTLGQVQQAITPANQISRPSSPHHGATVPPSPPGGVAPNGQSAVPSTATGSAGVRPTASCSPSPKAKAKPAPDTSATPTPTDSTTPTPTPTDSSTPTPTPTDTYSSPLRYVTSILDAVAAKPLGGAKQVAGARQLAAPCSSTSASAKAPSAKAT